MRIGIDARALIPKPTGIGNYVQNLVERLPLAGSGHEYLLYSNRGIHLSSPKTQVHQCEERELRLCPGTLWVLARGAALSRRDGLDIFWATATVLPPRIPPNILKVVTVYDLVWLLFPQTMAPRHRFISSLIAERAIRGADMIVTISQSTADDLVHLLGLPPERISIVYPGIAETFAPRNPRDAADYISRKYGVSPQYMAAVGTVEPRKNLALLPRVLHILKKNNQPQCPLLVAGASGWKTSTLSQNIRDFGLTEREIKFLGYIPQEDLPLFYAGAQAFLFPSLYEGFGIPPLEAMACGTPVIASNAKCMPEVLGDAALLQSPHDAEGFATTIARLLSQEDLRKSLCAAGIKRAGKFRWETSAKRILQTFELLALRDRAHFRGFESKDKAILQSTDNPYQ